MRERVVVIHTRTYLWSCLNVSFAPGPCASPDGRGNWLLFWRLFGLFVQCLREVNERVCDS